MLVRLTDGDVPPPRQSFTAQLSQWLGWTDAVALSAALNGAPEAPQGAKASANAQEIECSRVRAALAKAITEDDDEPAAADFPSLRQHYLVRQKTMDAGIGPLRARLRTALAAKSRDMARLAAVDAVMEDVLAPRERSLLATVPALLEKHFQRLRRDAAQDGQTPDDGGPWLDVFRQDMRGVMLAELNLRFQPVEGLLEALRAKQ